MHVDMLYVYRVLSFNIQDLNKQAKSEKYVDLRLVNFALSYKIRAKYQHNQKRRWFQMILKFPGR